MLLPTVPTRRALRLGDVVTTTHTGPFRGVVVAVHAEASDDTTRGAQALGARRAVVAATDGYRGTTRHTDLPIDEVDGHGWQVVAPAERSWEEQVVSAAAAWTPPAPDDEHDLTSFGWALMSVFVDALRPVAEDGEDWPTCWYELALDYARRLDGTFPSARASCHIGPAVAADPARLQPTQLTATEPVTVTYAPACP